MPINKYVSTTFSIPAEDFHAFARMVKYGQRSEVITCLLQKLIKGEVTIKPRELVNHE